MIRWTPRASFRSNIVHALIDKAIEISHALYSHEEMIKLFRYRQAEFYQRQERRIKNGLIPRQARKTPIQQVQSLTGLGERGYRGAKWVDPPIRIAEYNHILNYIMLASPQPVSHSALQTALDAAFSPPAATLKDILDRLKQSGDIVEVRNSQGHRTATYTIARPDRDQTATRWILLFIDRSDNGLTWSELESLYQPAQPKWHSVPERLALAEALQRLTNQGQIELVDGRYVSTSPVRNVGEGLGIEDRRLSVLMSNLRIHEANTSDERTSVYMSLTLNLPADEKRYHAAYRELMELTVGWAQKHEAAALASDEPTVGVEVTVGACQPSKIPNDTSMASIGSPWPPDDDFE